MLVLSRKINETVVIGNNIRITITDIKGGQVRLGVEAPRHVTVLRSELVNRELLDREEWWEERS